MSKILLPEVNQPCQLKFYNDTTYGIPYIKSIPPSSFIGKQIPQASLTQQYLISIENEEPIHAASATKEFQQLQRLNAKSFITI